MHSKKFVMGSALVAVLALSLVAYAQSAGAPKGPGEPGPSQATGGFKLMKEVALPCQAAAGHEFQWFYRATNDTGKAIPQGKAIHYTTSLGDKGVYKLSADLASGSSVNVFVKSVESGGACQAYFLTPY